MNPSQSSLTPPQIYQDLRETVEAIANFPFAVDMVVDAKEKPHMGHVSAAMAISVQAHEGQVRKDGTPTIGHPKRVAQNLLISGAGLDTALLCAGLLHDVVEDGGSPRQYRDAIFASCGKRVGVLVEAVTKAPCGHRRSHCPVCEANFISRILRASFRDPAILHLKLADVADNLDSIAGLSPVAARRYVKVSRVYVNFARLRLGASNRSYILCAARLRGAEVRLGKRHRT